MSDIIVESFMLDHYRAMGGENLRAAIISQISGPAFTLVRNGQILAVGGLRVLGIGQAWAELAPGAERYPKSVFKTARAVLEQSMAHEKVYRVYAEATVDKPAWFKHLGFVRQENLFVR